MYISFCLIWSMYKDGVWDTDGCVCACVRRCFALIESSTLEQTREETETEKMTHLESLVELGLSSTFSTILTQCSVDIFKVSHTPHIQHTPLFYWHLHSRY